MLHTNVIEGSGFRTLDTAELEAVSGGYFHEENIPGGFGSTGDQFGNETYQQHISLLEMWGVAPDGVYDAENNQIVVSAEPTNYGGWVSDKFYAVMSNDGGYVQYEKQFDSAWNPLSYTWVPVSYGTWSVSYSGMTMQGGTGFTIESGNRTITFLPEGSL